MNLPIKIAAKVAVELNKTGEGSVKTRQAVYVQRNIEGGSCNHCCSGKATSIACSE